MSERFISCRCQYCDKEIEFDADQLEEENRLVSCPHCGLETKLFIPIQPQKPNPLPINTQEKKKNYSKIIASLVFVLAVAIVASIGYMQNKRAEKNRLDEEQEFQQWDTPSLEKLQANAKNSLFELCSNDVVGLRRIVTTDFDFNDNNPTNWRARANVEFVNTVGGVERKDAWYVFDIVTNSSGGVRDVFAIEDPAR